MKFNFLCLISMLLSISAAHADILTNDQVNRLKLERRALQEERAAEVTEFIKNETLIDLLLKYGKTGDKPLSKTEKVALAVGSTATGVAGTTGVTLAANKIAWMKILERLPIWGQRAIKFAPGVSGVLVSGYMVYQAVTQDDAETQFLAALKSMTAGHNAQKEKDAIDQYYDTLLKNRADLADSITAISHEINKYDVQLAYNE